ncbi:MAG: hypothetical protein J0H35_10985 [Rhodospirillales bacterium]|nr:hypothetical protein [Rhodospirillales bacterium]
MTRAVVASTTPFTATWPPLVIVHLLPDASVIAVVEPAFTTVLSGEATGFGVAVGAGVCVGAWVGAGVGVVPVLSFWLYSQFQGPACV